MALKTTATWLNVADNGIVCDGFNGDEVFLATCWPAGEQTGRQAGD